VLLESHPGSKQYHLDFIPHSPQVILVQATISGDGMVRTVTSDDVKMGWDDDGNKGWDFWSISERFFTASSCNLARPWKLCTE